MTRSFSLPLTLLQLLLCIDSFTPLLQAAARAIHPSIFRPNHDGVVCSLRSFGYGKDDAPTFLSAVNSRLCSTIRIPKGETLNIATRLNMTGIKDKRISIEGTLQFAPDIPYWSGNGFFIPFQNQTTFWLLGGENIRLDGGGTIDGQGQDWWDAFAKNSSLARPISLTIFQAKNVVVENIRMIDSPEWFNLVNEAQDVTFRNISLSAVSTSSNLAKNTDGWDIYRSDNVVIDHGTINNGDDCVSFKPNSTNILVSNLACNGSHGISVGSLGQYPGQYDIVANVTAVNISMSNAQNGARIKAFAGSGVGSGGVKNITFSGFQETNVDNPVIIDQCYMTSASACSQFPSNVFIEDIWFDNISGTSSGKEKAVVASLDCSPGARCSSVNVADLNISPPTKYGSASYTCQNLVLSGAAAGLFGNCTDTQIVTPSLLDRLGNFTGRAVLPRWTLWSGVQKSSNSW